MVEIINHGFDHITYSISISLTPQFEEEKDTLPGYVE